MTTAQDQQSRELLPCPFCGGGVEIEETETTRSRRWWGVVCRNTTSRGGTCAIQQRASASIEAAVERWNRRALPSSMKPLDPMHPPGLTSANAILSFNHGWRACQLAHGITKENA